MLVGFRKYQVLLCTTVCLCFSGIEANAQRDLKGNSYTEIYHLNGTLIGRDHLTKPAACPFPKGVYLLEYQQKSYRLVH